MKLKDYVADALRLALYHPLAEAKADRVADDEADRLVLDENCVFPLIRGEVGPEMKGMTGEKIGRILEDEDVARDRDTR
jgi:hypothetical protein